MTLHTSPGCTVNVGSSGESGSMGATDCGADGGQTGCYVASGQAGSFGTDLNGVYATLWESNGIQIWYFPRGSVPQDITNNNPNPSGWGQPMASFGGCDNGNFDGHFANHNIVCTAACKTVEYQVLMVCRRSSTSTSAVVGQTGSGELRAVTLPLPVRPTLLATLARSMKHTGSSTRFKSGSK